jgi:hypothetical protein
MKWAHTDAVTVGTRSLVTGPAEGRTVGFALPTG